MATQSNSIPDAAWWEASADRLGLKHFGDEWKGPCPACSGKDRFRVNAAGFYCRQCCPDGSDPERTAGILEAAGWDLPGRDNGSRDKPRPNRKTATQYEAMDYPELRGAELVDPGTRGGFKPIEPTGRKRSWSYRSEEGGTVTVHRIDPTEDQAREDVQKRIWREGKAIEPFLPLDGFETWEDAPDYGIVICEGEATCDALREAGINATTGVGGFRLAKSTDWTVIPELSHVTLWPDVDAPGIEAMAQLAVILAGRNCAVRVVDTSNDPDKADAADFDEAERQRRVAWEHTLDLRELPPDHLLAVAFRAEETKLLEEKPFPVSDPIGEGKQETESGLQTITEAELMNSNEPDLAWIVDGLLFAGGFSLLTGRPKSGKTTLARNLAVKLAHGEDFLGRTTKQSEVLIVALEEHRAGFKAEWKRMDRATEDRVTFSIGMPEDMSEFYRRMAVTVKAGQYDLVIIDHLGHVARTDDLNDYAKTRTALDPYRQLARQSGAHVMLLHHSKKQGGDYGGEALGSTAITGLVDTALMIGFSGERREIYSINRHGEALEKTLLEFDAVRGAVDIGKTLREERDSDRDSDVWAWLEDQTEPTSVGAIAVGVSMSKKTLLPSLNRLVERGDVVRTGAGKRNDPILYSVSVSVP